jgi:uncharacterized protein YjcR
MNRIKQLVVSLGGTSAVAQKIGVKPQTVSSWIKREKVPFDNWESLVEIGATWDQLRCIHKKKQGEKSAECVAVA